MEYFLTMKVENCISLWQGAREHDGKFTKYLMLKHDKHIVIMCSRYPLENSVYYT